jgi:hypothetical protein
LHPAVAFDIINRFRGQWGRLEEVYGIRIEAHGDSQLPAGQWKLWTAKEGADWVLRKASEVDEYVRNN